MTALDTLLVDILAAVAKAKPGLLASATSKPRTDAQVVAFVKAALAPPVPPPIPTAPATPFALGALPSELAGVLRWPAPPAVSRSASATDPATLRAALAQPGTRVTVRAAISGEALISASDVDIVGDGSSTARIERLVIGAGVRRIRVSGLRIGSVYLSTPATWSGQPAVAAWDSGLFPEDVLIQNATIDAVNGNAFEVRGRRVAIVNCTVHARDFCVWAGDTGPLNSEDLIIAGCRMDSDGPQATLRVHDVTRCAVVDNRLANPVKHAYRVHGRSDLIWATRNVLVDAGMMLGTEPGDDCDRLWFVANTMYHRLLSLLEIVHPAQQGGRQTIKRLVWSNNVLYSDVWPDPDAWSHPPPPSSWSVVGNVRHPYRAAPP